MANSQAAMTMQPFSYRFGTYNLPHFSRLQMQNIANPKGCLSAKLDSNECGLCRGRSASTMLGELQDRPPIQLTEGLSIFHSWRDCFKNPVNPQKGPLCWHSHSRRTAESNKFQPSTDPLELARYSRQLHPENRWLRGFVPEGQEVEGQPTEP